LVARPVKREMNVRFRSNLKVIRVYDESRDVIETHEHAGEFKEW